MRPRGGPAPYVRPRGARGVPEIVTSDRGRFRRFVLSGLGLWVSSRWDHVLGRSGNTYAAGVGLDVGRSVILPVLLATSRRR